MKKKYRIVADGYAGYEEQFRYPFIPFWFQCFRCNTSHSIEAAEKLCHKHAEAKELGVAAMTFTHDVPMPEPVLYRSWWENPNHEGIVGAGHYTYHRRNSDDREPLYTADQLRAYAEARCAKLQAELDQCRQLERAAMEGIRRADVFAAAAMGNSMRAAGCTIVDFDIKNVRAEKAEAERDALAEKVKAMEADARRVFALYPRHWEVVDGGLFVDESNVAEFDAAFGALGVRLGLLIEDNEDGAVIDAAGGDQA